MCETMASLPGVVDTPMKQVLRRSDVSERC